MKSFAATSHPLSGMSLVEASAGTGKTHAITTLLVRTLLEEQVPLSKILVVTYTRAATAELRVRVRKRIAEAVRLLDGLAGADDDLRTAVDQVCSLRGASSVRAALLEALDAADRAPVHTIHGFCQRLLQEFSLELGVNRDVEIIQNDWPLRRQLARDFWIKELDAAPRWLIAELQRRAITVDSLADLGTLPAQVPLLGPARFNPNGEPPIDGLRGAKEGALELWRRDRLAISELLLQSAALNRNRYRVTSVEKWLSTLDLVLREESITLPDWFAKLTQHGIEEGTKRGHVAPSHPFFASCEALARLVEQTAPIADAAIYDFQRRFVELTRSAIAERIERSRMLTYDDLVYAVHAGLIRDHDTELSSTLQKRYPVALVDEFQDTDELQYDIFRRIYARSGTAVFVGDPKQAIYAFRGADVFSYLRAADEAAESSYTMQRNWRSVPRMVQATNALFGGRESPFLAEQIAFRPTAAAIRDSDRETDGIHIARVRPAKTSSAHSQQSALSAATEATAREVLALISGAAPHAPQDIAVLCRTNAQAADVAAMLRVHDVPVSLDGDLCVFDTPTAADVEIMLEAIHSPTSTRALRRLLFSDTIGFTAQNIVELDVAPDGWMDWQIRALRWNDLAKARGAGSALRAQFADTEVERRLATRHDGRRVLTDLHHLSELVHRVEYRERLDLAGSLRWLRDVRSAPRLRNELPAEELQQRPDGSNESVRVTTIHKSKGLEYGVVVLPFGWLPPWISQQERRTVRFHDPNDDYRMKLDLGSDQRDAHVELAEEENFAESLRLLYVAITRARRSCIVLLPNTDEWARSSFGYLLKAPRDEQGQRGVLAELVKSSESTIVVRDAVHHADRVSKPSLDPESLESRMITRTLIAAPRITSFSELVRQAGVNEAGLRAVDEAFPQARDSREPLADLPGGARTGLLVHDILERISWANIDGPETLALVRSRLLDHGFSPALTESVAQSLKKIGSVPLFAEGPSLATIAADKELRELEFTLRLAPSPSAAALADAFSEHAMPRLREYAASLRQIELSTLQRFLRGFIDLVFEHEGKWYIVDYKSNVLPEYGQTALHDVMTRHHYVLQYHLYTVALERYLRQRVPDFSYDAHFGGALFVFLRGLTNEPGRAVFSDKPSVELIRALGRALGGDDAC